MGALYVQGYDQPFSQIKVRQQQQHLRIDLSLYSFRCV